MKKEEEQKQGVPEWVVTYGDMMSLLLTFFIMLVSLSEIKSEKKVRALLDAIRESFGYTTAPASVPGPNYSNNSSIFERILSQARSRMQDTEKGGTRSKARQGKHVSVRRIRDGEAVTVGGAIAFDEFQAGLNEGIQEDLDLIAEVLAGKPNKVEIRGHATRKPLPPDSPFRNHWELSFGRAMAVMQYLTDRGIRPERIRLSAAGATEVVTEARNEEERQTNRRVEIFVLDRFSGDYVGGGSD